jgi:hypothetical protein
MSEDENISFEEVKKFVDEKRKVIRELTPEEKQKRLMSLEKGRETIRRNRELKNKEIQESLPQTRGRDTSRRHREIKIEEPPPLPMKSIKAFKPIKPEEDGYETLIEKPTMSRHKSYDDSIDKFKNLEEKLNGMNDLILKSLEKKVRPKRVVKPKTVDNTLDLTNDNEINNIINENKNNVNVDKKLQEFLKALKK